MNTTAHGSQEHFAVIPEAQIERSAFDRSHQIRTTFNAGYLIPFYADEMLPGDTIHISPTYLCRMTTLLYPLMDNLYLETFFFMVPNRLLWDDWKHFMGEKDNPADATTYQVPVVRSATNGFAFGSIADYIGVPPLATSGTTHDVCAFWHRAYNLIYKEWFRDQNLVDSPAINKGAGPDAVADYPLRKRMKRADYFTSSLPWPQRGSAVTLPLGTSAPVNFTLSTSAGPQFQNSGATKWGTLEADSNSTTPLLKLEAGTGTWTGGENMYWKTLGFTATADLSLATAATVNQVRSAFQLQKLLERDARGGTRYVEQLKSHFGVTSPDFRQQRPEYIGGGSINIGINQVAQTTGITGKTADLAAYGVAVGQNSQIVKSADEHCIILGLCHVRADLSYQQGEPRMFHRRDKYDFYWPALSHLGEQAVLNREIYMAEDGNNDLTWGYQERYAEYKYGISKTTNSMRSTFSTPLDVWHLAQKFTSRPNLNQTFMEDTPPISRVVAYTANDHFLLDAHMSINHVRPMPTYSVPGMLDHF